MVVYDQTSQSDVDPGEVGSRIDPVLARSWLLVNGAQYNRFAPAARSRADIVVLDIEDAVAPKDKLVARENVVRWLTSGPHPDADASGPGIPGGAGDWVRVNGFGTPWWADDLDALAQTPVGGIMLAMVESVDHITETAKRVPNVPIVALVETARGLERISEIAAAKGTFRLAFGIGDFRRDTGFGANPLTLAYARSRFTIAAKAAHLPSAIDGPTVGSGALKLSEATAISVEFGMTGKICLTPDQCAPVNEGLSPSIDDISWAKEFFADFEREGGEIRNGSDLPRIARATKILDLARAYGVTESDYEVDPGHASAPSDTYHY
ncbi:MAG: CoA ester lyase [Gordonia sp. (in: high G+C Gram-positive bacteria)]